MANVEKGEFDLVLDGKTYTLTLKTAALMALQKHFSTAEKLADLDAVMQRVEAGSIEHVVAFLWACLRKYHPEISFDQAMNLIDESGGLQELNRHFTDLAGSINPDPKDAKELAALTKPKRPHRAQAKHGTGGNGTSSHVASA